MKARGIPQRTPRGFAFSLCFHRACSIINKYAILQKKLFAEKGSRMEVHICPVKMKTVLFDNGKCTEEVCQEKDCPIMVLQSQEREE